MEVCGGRGVRVERLGYCTLLLDFHGRVMMGGVNDDTRSSRVSGVRYDRLDADGIFTLPSLI